MASAKQGVKVLPSKKGTVGLQLGQNLFILVKKTGYYSFSLNGQTYYYNEKMDINKISQEILLLAFNGGANSSQKKKKGKITVTKK